MARRPKRSKVSPRDLRAFLTREIDIQMDTQEPLLYNLSVCLREHLQISRCTELQGILALLIALRCVCTAFPGGSNVIRELLSDLLFTRPAPPPGIIDNDDNEPVDP